MKRAVQVGALFFIGSLLLQTAWIITVPPFRAIDEIDHIYRVAAVADGQWSVDLEGRGGREGEVMVPADLVAAAEHQCWGLDYMEAENCSGTEVPSSGFRRVQSAATTQNPVPYLILGLASRPFEGVDFLYAARLSSAVVNAAVIAAAAAMSALWSVTRWPTLMLVLAFTPVTVYSTIIPSANGLEITAGMLVWVALAGLVRPSGAQTQRWLIVAASVGAMMLVSLRQMGPLWLAMILGVWLLLVGPERIRHLWRVNRLWSGVGLVVVGTAGLLHTSWMSNTGYPPTGDYYGEYPLSQLPQDALLWALQGIATGAFRNQPAPLTVYSIYAAVGVILCWVLLRVRPVRREALALGLVVSGTLLLPALFTVLTYSSRGSFWQGRYLLAFSLGFFFVVGYIADRRDRPPTSTWILMSGLVFLAVTHASTLLSTLRTELSRPISITDESWQAPSPVTLSLLVGAGFLALAVALNRVPAYRDE